MSWQNVRTNSKVLTTPKMVINCPMSDHKFRYCIDDIIILIIQCELFVLCSQGNADRHHYETFDVDGDNGRLLHLDNGKR